MMNPYVQRFYQTGFSIVPLEYRSKKPLVKWSEFQTAQPDAALLSRWFSGQVNLGIVTGYSNLTVIDFDNFTEFARWQKWITGLSNYAIVSRAFQVRSRRGVHVYFRVLQPERNRHIDKVDIKGRYGLVTGPGSVHESGIVYQPLNAFFIPTVEALSDVLPAQLLLSGQDISPVVSLPDLPKSTNDPWEAAEMGGAAPGEDLVSKVRDAFKIEQFFKTPLHKSGTHFYVTQCPFHDDQKPSFWIDTEHQVCGCFVCNFPKPLDVINLYGMLYGLNNRDAILTLARMT
ncbi:MAG: bifunctional DNA primase/polymerase [Anaerolineales bacterium]